MGYCNQPISQMRELRQRGVQGITQDHAVGSGRGESLGSWFCWAGPLAVRREWMGGLGLCSMPLPLQNHPLLALGSSAVAPWPLGPVHPDLGCRLTEHCGCTPGLHPLDARNMSPPV